MYILTVFLKANPKNNKNLNGYFRANGGGRKDATFVD
jgi:hypothetical protein